MYDDFSPVASQCPEEGGPGVLVARSILAATGYSQSYDDELSCYPQQI
jgi:hypothetical protein